jgi:hypothetical protein
MSVEIPIRYGLMSRASAVAPAVLNRSGRPMRVLLSSRLPSVVTVSTSSAVSDRRSAYGWWRHDSVSPTSITATLR